MSKLNFTNNNPWLSNLVEVPKVTNSYGNIVQPPPQFPILKDEDPRLRLKAKPVKVPNNQIKWMCNYMLSTMRMEQGVGLAAPQIGYNIRVIVIDPPISHPIDKKKIHQFYANYMANPFIIEFSGEQITNEGCLSNPGVFRKVKRAEEITVQWEDIRTGEIRTREFTGLPAVIIQHEIDHLDGKLFTDYEEAK